MAKRIRQKRIKDVFTTGEVVKMCHCSNQTIIRCFEKEILKGYYVPGGSRDRRFTKAMVIKFMKEQKIPLNGLEEKTVSYNGFFNYQI